MSGDQGRDRSRSGRDGESRSAWISREVAGIGRYPAKRPPGLAVDSSGAFSLKSLTACWGRRHGVDEPTILRAIRAHMFHEEGSSLRFAIYADDDGQVLIRVHPKRVSGGSAYNSGGGGGPQRAPPPVRLRRPPSPEPDPVDEPVEVEDAEDEEAVPEQAGTWRPAILRTAEQRGCATPARTTRPQIGRGWCQRPPGATAKQLFEMWRGPLPPPPAPEPEPEAPLPNDKADAEGPGGGLAEKKARQLSAMDKLMMPLDEVIRKEGGWGKKSWGDSGDTAERRARVQQACRQMGWTEDTRHLRLGPAEDRRRPDGDRRPPRAARRPGTELTPAERVQRWVAWALKVGHRELGIEVRADGAARLAELALALPKSFGEFDASSLHLLLQEAAAARRFQVTGDGYIRRVPRSERRGNRTSPSPERDGIPRRGRELSRSPSPSSSSCGEGEVLAEHSRDGPAAPVADRGAPMDTSAVQGPPAAQGTPPPMPPGPHWTQYTDPETGSWWHYSGPLGEWWLEEGAKVPTPYEDTSIEL